MFTDMAQVNKTHTTLMKDTTSYDGWLWEQKLSPTKTNMSPAMKMATIHTQEIFKHEGHMYTQNV